MGDPRVETPREAAVRIAGEAGELLLERFGHALRVRHKGVVDLVTEADEQSERHIIRSIHERFPDHAVLAEESGASRPDGTRPRHRWLVDPLDGTTNFAHGYPIFAVSLALEVDGVVELGVVDVPYLGELYVAEHGGGATLNGEAMHVSTTEDLIHALVASGFQYDLTARRGNLPHWAAFVEATQGARRSGAAAFDLCCVAAGRLDGYWEAGLSPWDAAAGALAVEEAGGKVTTYRGDPFRVDAPECLASNGRVHAQMLSVLARGSQRPPGGAP